MRARSVAQQCIVTAHRTHLPADDARTMLNMIRQFSSVSLCPTRRMATPSVIIRRACRSPSGFRLPEMMLKQLAGRFLARIQREGEWGDDVEIEADTTIVLVFFSFFSTTIATVTMTVTTIVVLGLRVCSLGYFGVQEPRACRIQEFLDPKALKHLSCRG